MKWPLLLLSLPALLAHCAPTQPPASDVVAESQTKQAKTAQTGPSLFSVRNDSDGPVLVATLPRGPVPQLEPLVYCWPRDRNLPESKADQQALLSRLWDCDHIQRGTVSGSRGFTEVIVTSQSGTSVLAPSVRVEASITGGQTNVKVYVNDLLAKSLSLKECDLRDRVASIAPENTARFYSSSVQHKSCTTIEWKRDGGAPIELSFDGFDAPDCLARIQSAMFAFEREVRK